jgi:hypothetical protein
MAISIAKYLNPSPATAKGHMKRLQMGICSTQGKGATEPVPALAHTYHPLCNDQTTDSLINDIQPCPVTNANIIEDANRSSDANIFCFAAFADKQTGILYNNLARTLPLYVP